MKQTITRQEKSFVPVTFSVTFESRSELIDFLKLTSVISSRDTIPDDWTHGMYIDEKEYTVDCDELIRIGNAFVTLDQWAELECLLK